MEAVSLTFLLWQGGVEVSLVGEPLCVIGTSGGDGKDMPAGVSSLKVCSDSAVVHFERVGVKQCGGRHREVSRSCALWLENVNSESESVDMGISKRSGSFRSPSKPKQLTSDGSSKTKEGEASEAGEDEHVGTWDKGESDGEGRGKEGDTGGEGANMGGDEVGVRGEEDRPEETRDSEPSSDMNI